MKQVDDTCIHTLRCHLQVSRPLVGIWDVAPDILESSLPLHFSQCHCAVVSLLFRICLGQYQLNHDLAALPRANTVLVRYATHAIAYTTPPCESEVLAAGCGCHPRLCASQRQTTATRQMTRIMGIMGNYGDLWGIMVAFWGIVGNYGGLWGIMGNYGDLWRNHEGLWEF